MSTMKIHRLAFFSRRDPREGKKNFITLPIPDLLEYDEGGPGLDIERGMYIRTLKGTHQCDCRRHKS